MPSNFLIKATAKVMLSLESAKNDIGPFAKMAKNAKGPTKFRGTFSEIRPKCRRSRLF